MNQVLSDEEITTITANGFSNLRYYARAIEAAVLAKFGEPVAYVDDWRDCIFGQLTEDYIESGTDLYAIKKEIVE